MSSASSLMKDAQKFSREQWNFEKNLSDTAHTREVQDLKNAGLNPILSANGSGASTPSVSSDSGVNAAASLQSALESAKVQREQIKAQKYAADMQYKAAQANAAATMYSSDKAYQSTVYNTDYNRSASVPGVASSIANKAYKAYKSNAKSINKKSFIGQIQSVAKSIWNSLTKKSLF